MSNTFPDFMGNCDLISALRLNSLYSANGMSEITEIIRL